MALAEKRIGITPEWGVAASELVSTLPYAFLELLKSPVIIPKILVGLASKTDPRLNPA